MGVGPFASNADEQLVLGGRIPLGLALEFRRKPAHVFLELAVRAELSPEVQTSFEGAIGFRWFF